MLVLHPQNIGAARMKAKAGAAMIDASQEANRSRTLVCVRRRHQSQKNTRPPQVRGKLSSFLLEEEQEINLFH
jgi:hypothetical protein